MTDLYIISCPKEQFRKHYKADSEKIDILSKDKEGLESIGYENLYTYSKQKISAFDLSLIRKLRKKKYNEIVYYYNNPNRQGYLGVELFILLLKAKKRKGVFQDGSERAVNWPVFVLSALIETIYCLIDILGCLIIALLTLPAALFINIYIKSLYKRSGKSVLFIGMGGKYSASFRVRCESFAKELLKRGYEAKAVDFYDLHDRYIKDNPSIFIRLWDTKRALMLSVMYFRIAWVYRKYQTLYCQKVDYPTISAYFSCLFSGRKFILDYDDWDKANFPDLFKRLKILFFLRFDWLTEYFIRKSSICVVASKYLEQVFKDKKVKNLFYIPTGVDAEMFSKKIIEKKDETVTISWMGTIYKINAEWLYFFLKIYKALQKQADGKSLSFEIAGEGTFEQHVKDFAEKEQIANIKYLGWLPHEMVPAYLARVDIGVFPMEKDREYERSKSPTKLFEYMTCGIPCVASRIGEPAQVIEDGKNGFLAENAEEFREKLLRLIQDKELRERMGVQAMKTIHQSYSLEKCGNLLEKVLEEFSPQSTQRTQRGA